MEGCEYRGLLGELAFGKKMNWEVDYARREKRRFWDFISPKSGKTVDVKLMTGNFRTALIMVHHPKGAKKLADIFVITKLLQEKNHTARIEIVGWISKEDLLKYPTVNGKLGSNHKNKEVPLKDLKKFEDICKTHYFQIIKTSS